MAVSSRAVALPERVSFARIPDIRPMPGLIQIQLDSFEWFKKEGLRELFEEISPIEDFTGKNSGGYGFFDNEFDARAEKLKVWSERNREGKTFIYKDIIAGEWMPSVCGEPVQRVTETHIINKRLFYKKHDGSIPQNRQILNFPWKLTYSNWL